MSTALSRAQRVRRLSMTLASKRQQGNSIEIDKELPGGVPCKTSSSISSNSSSTEPTSTQSSTHSHNVVKYDDSAPTISASDIPKGEHRNHSHTVPSSAPNSAKLSPIPITNGIHNDNNCNTTQGGGTRSRLRRLSSLQRRGSLIRSKASGSQPLATSTSSQSPATPLKKTQPTSTACTPGSRKINRLRRLQRLQTGATPLQTRSPDKPNDKTPRVSSKAMHLAAAKLKAEAQVAQQQQQHRRNRQQQLQQDIQRVQDEVAEAAQSQLQDTARQAELDRRMRLEFVKQQAIQALANRQLAAAMMLQRRYRGAKTRGRILTAQRIHAAVVIQTHTRAALANAQVQELREQLQLETTAATKLQSVTRGTQDRTGVKKLLEHRRRLKQQVALCCCCCCC